MRPFISLLIIICLPLIFSSAHKAEETNMSSLSMSNYCNSRFDFCVVYPSITLPVREVSVNDDGIILKTADENSTVSVHGSYNITNWSAEDLLKFSINSIIDERPGEAEIVSTNIGEDFYNCYFTFRGYHYFNHSIFVNDYYISLLIKIPEKQHLLMEQLQREVLVRTGNNG